MRRWLHSPLQLSLQSKHARTGSGRHVVLERLLTRGKIARFCFHTLEAVVIPSRADLVLGEPVNDHANESGRESLPAMGLAWLTTRQSLVLQRSAPRRWPPRPAAPNLFSDFRRTSECCRAAHNSNVQRNKRRWNAGYFTSAFLSYSRAREFSLPARLAAGKKKCVDVPRCDTASRADWQ